MVRGIQFLFAFIVLREVISSKDVKCSVDLPEIRFLMNFDKLLNRENVRIVNGIRLKRKLNEPFNEPDPEFNTSLCAKSSEELLQVIESKFTRMAETHVLEFDLAPIVSNGNV